MIGRSRFLLPVAVGALVLATLVDLGWRLGASGLDHSVGVYVMLAELARAGCVYPPVQTPEMVYCTLYQPFGFLPYALLPGSGLTLVPSIRALVRVEVVLSVVVVLTMLRRTGSPAHVTWAVISLLLGALPVTAASLTCIDDPRGALVAGLALWTFVGGGRAMHPWRAAPLFALAFFTKLGAPCGAGVAALAAAWLAKQPRAGWMLLGACALWTLAGYLFAHGVLGWDLAGNGLRYALFDAKPGRDLGLQMSVFARDLVREPVTAVVLVGGLAGCLWRLQRRVADALDAWLLAALLRAFVEYRSHGTELNHLFEPCLLGAVCVARTFAARLVPWHVLVLLALVLLSGRPVLGVARGDHSALAQAPINNVAALLRAQPPAPTLCEDALLAVLSGARPIVTDAFLASRVLLRHPEIRAAWFGPKGEAHALQRLVLLVNPISDSRADHWYGNLHFDAQFLADVRREFDVVAPSDFGTLLQRR